MASGRCWIARLDPIFGCQGGGWFCIPLLRSRKVLARRQPLLLRGLGGQSSRAERQCANLLSCNEAELPRKGALRSTQPRNEEEYTPRVDQRKVGSPRRRRLNLRSSLLHLGPVSGIRVPESREFTLRQVCRDRSVDECTMRRKLASREFETTDDRDTA